MDWIVGRMNKWTHLLVLSIIVWVFGFLGFGFLNVLIG